MTDQQTPAELSPEQRKEQALPALLEALAQFLRDRYDDDTMQLYGVVLQVSGTGVTGERMNTVHLGTTTEQLGLMVTLMHRIERANLPDE